MRADTPIRAAETLGRSSERLVAPFRAPLAPRAGESRSAHAVGRGGGARVGSGVGRTGDRKGVETEGVCRTVNTTALPFVGFVGSERALLARRAGEASLAPAVEDAGRERGGDGVAGAGSWIHGSLGAVLIYRAVGASIRAGDVLEAPCPTRCAVERVVLGRMACEADAVGDTPGARRRLCVDGTRDEVNGGLLAEAVRRTWDAFLGSSIRLVGPRFTCDADRGGVLGVARKADARVRVD